MLYSKNGHNYIGMPLEKALSEPVQTNHKRKCLKQAEKELAEEEKI